MSRWAMLIAALSVAALFFAEREKNARVYRIPGVGIVNAAAVIGKDPEYIDIANLQKAFAPKQLNADSIRPSFTGARGVVLTLNSEWSSFRRVSATGASIFNAVNEAGSMERLDRNNFRIKSDFEDKRQKLLADSLASLDASYKKASALKPEKTFAAEKLRLFNLRLKLFSLDQDNSYVMPDFRVAAIKEEAARIESTIYNEERSSSAATAERFRARSEEIQGMLDKAVEKLDKELSEALNESLKSEQASLERADSKEAENSKQAMTEASEARQKLMNSSSIPIPASIKSDNPTDDLEAQKKEVAAELLRRITRKSPAVAERNNLGIIYNTPYPPVDGTVDVSAEF